MSHTDHTDCNHAPGAVGDPGMSGGQIATLAFATAGFLGFVWLLRPETEEEKREYAARYGRHAGRPRENPSSDNGIWYGVGAALVVFVGAGVLTARSASAAAPPPSTPQPPNPMPIRRPPQPDSSIVRQSSSVSPTSSSSVRIMQQQLQQLGYTITRIDGIPGPELQRATLQFEDDAGISHFTGDLELMLLIDQRYAHVFDPTGNRAVV